MNKYTTTSLIIELYFIIISQLKKVDLVQYSYFSYIIADSHGILVFLKVLNLDGKYIERNKLIESIQEEEYPTFTKTSFQDILEYLILFDLKLIYKICGNKEDFIYKYLYEIKLYIFLKKMLTIYNNPVIKKYCLKLLKCQLKFFDKNLKSENMFIISNIYTSLSYYSTKDLNYLKYVKKDNTAPVSKLFSSSVSKNNSNPVNNQEDQLKKMYVEYNNFHFYKYVNNPEEVEKYYLSKKGSAYSKVYLKLIANLNEEKLK